jgi:hypothetical protein
LNVPGLTAHSFLPADLALSCAAVEGNRPAKRAPGWYTDPDDQAGKRYWDGQQWSKSEPPKTETPNPTRIVIDRHGNIETPLTPEQRERRRRSNIGAAIFGAVVLIAFAVIYLTGSHDGGSSETTSEPVAAPPTTATASETRPFAVTEQNVSTAVQDALANAITPIEGAPTVSCEPTGDWCQIDYTVKRPLGMSADLELLAPTRGIWKKLFSDPRFDNGTMVVSGPTTTVGGKSEESILFTLSCDRRAAAQIDWNVVDGKGIRTLCKYIPAVNGI